MRPLGSIEAAPTGVGVLLHLQVKGAPQKPNPDSSLESEASSLSRVRSSCPSTPAESSDLSKDHDRRGWHPPRESVFVHPRKDLPIHVELLSKHAARGLAGFHPSTQWLRHPGESKDHHRCDSRSRCDPLPQTFPNPTPTRGRRIEMCASHFSRHGSRHRSDHRSRVRQHPQNPLSSA